MAFFRKLDQSRLEDSQPPVYDEDSSSILIPTDASQVPKSQQGFSNINKRKFEATQQSQNMEGAIDLIAYVNQINQESKPQKKNKLAGGFSVKNEVEVVQQQIQDQKIFKAKVNKKYNLSPAVSKNGVSDPPSQKSLDKKQFQTANFACEIQDANDFFGGQIDRVSTQDPPINKKRKPFRSEQPANKKLKTEFKEPEPPVTKILKPSGFLVKSSTAPKNVNTAKVIQNSKIQQLKSNPFLQKQEATKFYQNEEKLEKNENTKLQDLVKNFKQNLSKSSGNSYAIAKCKYRVPKRHGQSAIIADLVSCELKDKKTMERMNKLKPQIMVITDLIKPNELFKIYDPVIAEKDQIYEQYVPVFSNRINKM